MQGFSPQNTQNDAERGVWVLLIFRVFCVFCGKKVLLSHFGALAAREAASQQFVHSAWREHTQMSNTASGP